MKTSRHGIIQRAKFFHINTPQSHHVLKETQLMFCSRYTGPMFTRNSPMEEKSQLGLKHVMSETLSTLRDLSGNLTISLMELSSPTNLHQPPSEFSSLREAAVSHHATKSSKKSSAWKTKTSSWFSCSETRKSKTSYWEKSSNNFIQDSNFITSLTVATNTGKDSQGM